MSLQARSLALSVGAKADEIAVISQQLRQEKVMNQEVEDNEKERERVESLYKDIRIHQIYESFSIAFRSYFAVKDFADSEGVEILNATPGSFIDAFPRTRLELLG